MLLCSSAFGLFGDGSPPESPDPTQPRRRPALRATAPARPKPERSDANGGSRWLSIEAACQMLGVDQSTLRRWSDDGKIPVFRTPGGHRRYAEEDLKALVKGDHRRRRVSRETLTNLSLSAYERASRADHRDQTWRLAYDAATLHEMRPLGRRMVDLSIRYIAGRGDRDEILAESREIAARYGYFSARAGLTTAEALEAFLYFRTPVVQAVTQQLEDDQAPPRRAARLIGDLTAFMDQILLATILSHEDHADE